MVMAPNALELVQKAAGMDAKSAATPRSGSKQFLTTNKTWRTNEAARIAPTSDGVADAMPAVNRQHATHEGALAAFSRAAPRRTGAGLASESARWFSFPPQIGQSVCPPKGIWTTAQPLMYCCSAAQLHAEVVRRIDFTRDMQDRSRTTADDC